MSKQNISGELTEADQSVKNFIALLLETFNSQIENQKEPLIEFQYFGANFEVRLTSFRGVYVSDKNERKSC